MFAEVKKLAKNGKMLGKKFDEILIFLLQRGEKCAKLFTTIDGGSLFFPSDVGELKQKEGPLYGKDDES